MYSILKIAAVFSMTACCMTQIQADSFTEDFESCTPGPLAGQNGWKERAYGKHPAGDVIIEKNGDGNEKKILKSPGPGDHYFFKSIPNAKEIFSKNYILVEFTCRNGAYISFGEMQEYGKTAIDISLTDKLSIKLNGKDETKALKTVNASKWTNVVAVLCRQENGSYKVFCGIMPATGKDNAMLEADPLIAEKELEASQINPRNWKNIGIRIDSNQDIRSVKVSGFEKLENLPFKLDTTGKNMVDFNANLDYILSPRQGKDISGLWEAASAPLSDNEIPADKWTPVLVPEQHGKFFSDKTPTAWFRKNIKIDRKESDKKYFLYFERVTDSCEIYVNGQVSGKSDDGHFPFKIDISKQLVEGLNQIAVRVFSPTAVNAKGNRPIAWDWLYNSYTGIPFPVHLETANELMIEDVFVIPHRNPETALESRIRIRNYSSSAKTFTVSAECGEKFRHKPEFLSLAPGESREIILKDNWKNPELWWPYDPRMQNLDIRIADQDGRILDAYRQSFGFRTVEVNGSEMLLNGVPFIHKRTSNILFRSMTLDEKRNDYIKLLRSRGYNGSRLHGCPGVPPVIRNADRNGWLLAPEAAIITPQADKVSESFWPEAKKHIRRMIATYKNNPSVIYWCLSNEFAGVYMGGSEEQKKDADTKMAVFGKMASELDPSRTWTCSGDGELGGKGHNGPAPTLSFHYAWQPFKLNNLIPETADWLERGIKPWQGIRWNKDKPLMLSEDLYPPYCLKFPQGMSQWCGDTAYDPEKGVYQAWFETIRMMAGYYYKAGVSVWNPWGVGETEKDNPIFTFGIPMPDFLIFDEDLSNNVYGNSSVSRKFTCFNKSFKDEELKLISKSNSGGETRQVTVSIPAGRSVSQELTLKFPSVNKISRETYTIQLVDKSARCLAEKTISFSVFSENKVSVPPGMALLSTSPLPFTKLSFPGGLYRDLENALAANPSSLLITGISTDQLNMKLLDKAVSNGLKVLWLEASPSSSLPIRADKAHHAQIAYMRSFHDPALEGFSGDEFRFWRPSSIVAHNTILKPENETAEILLDCGSSGGLNFAALMRFHYGQGYYLFCQMPIAESWDKDPAAQALFNNLLKSLETYKIAESSIATVIGNDKDKLKTALKSAGIPFSETRDQASVKILNGRASLSKTEAEALANFCKNGGNLFVSGISLENVGHISRAFGVSLEVNENHATQMLIADRTRYSDGLSNDDLFWMQGDEFISMIDAHIYKRKFKESQTTTPMIDGVIKSNASAISYPFKPTAVAVLKYGKGRLMLSTIRWEDNLASQPVKAKRLIAKLLASLGATVSVSKTGKTVCCPLDLKPLANRGFWHKNDKDAGWFGNPSDDLRYFPVNLTGRDPDNGLPQPPDKFPPNPVNYAGIDFNLINPDENSGKSCLILGEKSQTSLPVNKTAEAVWILGAADSMFYEDKQIASLCFVYADGSKNEIPFVAGKNLNGYQYYSRNDKSLCAWTGKTPSRRDAVLWCWKTENPNPEKSIKSIVIKTDSSKLGIIAASLEIKAN